MWVLALFWSPVQWLERVQLFGSDLDRWVLYGTSHTARSRHRTQALDRKTCAEPETTKTRISEHASVGTVPRQLPRITNPAASTGKPDWPSTRDGATTRLSMLDNFRFYGIPRHQWPELVRMDLLEPAWASNAAIGERSGWCDAIVCDPPYGIREGTRQARIRSSKQVDTRQGQRKRAPFAVHLEALFRLAARVLRPGGRLVLWLPAVAELTAYDLPLHEALVYFGTPCCQRMRGGLRRYLLVLVKRTSANALPDPNVQNEVFYKEAPPRYQRAHENLAARLFGVAERDEQHLRPRSFCQS
ncbi:tRNA methyltransferase 11 [Cyanidiococcus yangmingshanensis]|uniref:tRNA methyltransferase 11 n=1 Tax=Cyanidiococcus yangmingshanensis TaxID=2690220 RepID=A0A7J7ILN3_9RHOD|nr:tRNA methyltransferase 11 [Cyanidiococcus yangmingshanensis]